MQCVVRRAGHIEQGRGATVTAWGCGEGCRTIAASRAAARVSYQAAMHTWSSAAGTWEPTQAYASAWVTKVARHTQPVERAASGGAILEVAVRIAQCSATKR
jgi:hypothetical protein